MEENTCAICMEGLWEGDTGGPMVMACGHVFHELCLEQCLEFKRECPTCRKKLKGARRSRKDAEQLYPLFLELNPKRLAQSGNYTALVSASQGGDETVPRAKLDAAEKRVDAAKQALKEANGKNEETLQRLRRTKEKNGKLQEEATRRKVEADNLRLAVDMAREQAQASATQLEKLRRQHTDLLAAQSASSKSDMVVNGLRSLEEVRAQCTTKDELIRTLFDSARKAMQAMRAEVQRGERRKHQLAKTKRELEALRNQAWERDRSVEQLERRDARMHAEISAQVDARVRRLEQELHRMRDAQQKQERRAPPAPPRMGSDDLEIVLSEPKLRPTSVPSSKRVMRAGPPRHRVRASSVKSMFAAQVKENHAPPSPPPRAATATPTLTATPTAPASKPAATVRVRTSAALMGAPSSHKRSAFGGKDMRKRMRLHMHQRHQQKERSRKQLSITDMFGS